MLMESFFLVVVRQLFRLKALGWLKALSEKLTWRLVVGDSAIFFHAERELRRRRHDVLVGLFNVIFAGSRCFDDFSGLGSGLK